ncbi:MAG: hypothetical protein JSW52_04910 [Candidatus Coatesbacteria bacterium]|nr:MAG: hypothetical protein JSW52_04910 [Candidatus Coatesbacteria bacterium]
MVDDERIEILKRVEAGEITAAQAEELLDALEEEPEDEPEREGEEFTDITEWSPDGPITELKIDNFVGKTEVRAGEETLVVATVRVRARDAETAKEFFDKVNLTFDEKKGKARIKADVTKGVLDIFRVRKVAVDFDVTMPADVALKTALGNGSIETEGIETVAGNIGNGKVVTDGADVNLNIGNGKVHSDGARKLELDIGNGKLYVGGAEVLEVFKANFGNGKLKLDAGRLNENADYELKFGNGKLSFEFAAKPTNCEIKIIAPAANVVGDLPFGRKGGTWTYEDGEPKARVKIKAAHAKVEIAVKEEA